METMRLLFLLLIIWADHRSGAAAQPPPPPTAATLDLTVAANYPQFITNMRNFLSEKDKTGNDALLCSMQKISQKIPSPRYAYVDIKASETQTITLAIDRADTYVLGYRDYINGNERAFFFKEVFDKARDLFPNARGNSNRIKLGFTSQYTALGDRTKVPLGIKSFRTSITSIYGKATSTKDFVANQRTFFLLALQMVAEATRFKHISDKIPTDKDFKTLTVDAEVKALENGWDKLSTATYMANKCILQNPVLLDLDGKKEKWVFNSVEKIANHVALLKAKDK